MAVLPPAFMAAPVFPGVGALLLLGCPLVVDLVMNW